MNLKSKKSLQFISIVTLIILFFSIILITKKYNETKDVLAKEKNLPIHSVNVEDKKISLTFDVNFAEKDYLNNILNILEKYNIKGTFFVMGSWINYTEENGEKLKLIADKGHEIGNHSYIHPNFSQISDEKIEKEIRKTDETIRKFTKDVSKLFRFPSGDYNEKAVRKVKDLGYIPIQWDVDSIDWREDGEKVEYERVKKKVKNGSIILYHNNAKYTTKNLERIIKELKEEGYEFKTVGEIIYKENYYIDSEGLQHKKI